MIQRLSYNYAINPAILTEGFFWFKDLSSPDPTGILPVLGGMVSLLNILTTSAANSSPAMRKFRKYLQIMPLLTIPIWMTFPAVSSNMTVGVQSILVDYCECATYHRELIQI